MSRRSRLFEELEQRCVLAATADIVFVVDESKSALIKEVNNNDVSLLHEWVADLATALDDKLESRGIKDNRYFLTSIGGEAFLEEKYNAHYNVDQMKNVNGSPRHVDLDDDPSVCGIQLFGTADDLATSITSYDSLHSGDDLGGSSEDGWWGIYFAAKGEPGNRTGAGEDGTNPLCGGPNDTDGFANTLYDFRSNAAVHFILVSDEPSTELIRTDSTPDFSKNLDDMLEALEMSSLKDADNTPNEIADAVVTAIVPTMFEIPGITDPILGVDADVFDKYDVDVDDDILRYVRLLGTWVGDSNYDFQFNSEDVVVVFAIGEYEDSINNNSGWGDGDWNFDEDFDSGDVVFAFSGGGYELGFIYVSPKWADSAFSGTVDFYLPTWGW